VAAAQQARTIAEQQARVVLEHQAAHQQAAQQQAAQQQYLQMLRIQETHQEMKAQREQMHQFQQRRRMQAAAAVAGGIGVLQAGGGTLFVSGQKDDDLGGNVSFYDPFREYMLTGAAHSTSNTGRITTRTTFSHGSMHQIPLNHGHPASVFGQLHGSGRWIFSGPAV
jgi:hypothetical protein